MQFAKDDDKTRDALIEALCAREALTIDAKAHPWYIPRVEGSESLPQQRLSQTAFAPSASAASAVITAGNGS